MHPMPEIEFAFLADAVDAPPGQKFNVLGGGITQIAGAAFPLVHPHLALVTGLTLTAPEAGREHELRIALLDPDGNEQASTSVTIVAQPQPGGRDALLTLGVDLWHVEFRMPGVYSMRLLVNGSERKRLALVLVTAPGQQVVPGSEPPGGQHWVT